MPDDDLTVFAKACQEFQQEISIRGSTAYHLTENENTQEGGTSIVKSVPPLGDLDLIVRDENPAEAMRKVGNVLERYRTYVPGSRFIHVDVFYEGLPVIFCKGTPRLETSCSRGCRK